MYVSLKAILDHANKHNYAVMAMNSINMEMARAGIEAAEEMHSPIIIQIGPGQMRRHAHMTEMLPMVKALAERASVPVCLHMDHGSTFDDIVACIQAGFSSVMFDGSSLPFEENVKRTAIICELAHAKGISVEAELGHVGQANDMDDLKEDFLTDPAVAKEFVERTGVDALAVAIGTAHGAYPKGKIPKLDFERLTALKDTLKMPLVLHGGSGSGPDNIHKAVALGINKINVATDAFQAAKDAMMNASSMDYLGMCIEAEKGVKMFVKDYISMIGSADRFTFENGVCTSNE